MLALALGLALGIFGGLYVYRLPDMTPTKRELWITAGVLVGICGLSFYGFSEMINHSSFYEGIVFREIARNNHAVGDLSRLLCTIFLFIMIGAVLLHSIRTTGSALEKVKDVLFPNTRWGKIAMAIILSLLVIVSLESTCRKFYTREMVAYFNQLVAIANTPTYKPSGSIKRFFDAKLAQIDSMAQFYVIEEELLQILKRTNQERPKRLREKFKLFDYILTSTFPRGAVDKAFQKRLQDELKTLQ